MPRAKKTNKGKKEFGLFDGDESGEGGSEEELPKDEVGRLKIKRRYEELLGIRTMKLRGRVFQPLPSTDPRGRRFVPCPNSWPCAWMGRTRARHTSRPKTRRCRNLGTERGRNGGSFPAP